MINWNSLLLVAAVAIGATVSVVAVFSLGMRFLTDARHIRSEGKRKRCGKARRNHLPHRRLRNVHTLLDGFDLRHLPDRALFPPRQVVNLKKALGQPVGGFFTGRIDLWLLQKRNTFC